MLSSVLNSEKAIKVNIQIMRIYVRIRQLITLNKEILERLEEIELKDSEQDKKIMLIFEYLKQLEQAKQQEEEQQNRKRIGYRREG